MSGRSATIGAITVVVALFLVLSGCRLQPDDPADDDAQPDAPNIEATVQSALRSLEERQPPTPDGADQRPPAPTFAGALLDGNEYRLADTLGTPTLLMFWAPW